MDNTEKQVDSVLNFFQDKEWWTEVASKGIKIVIIILLALLFRFLLRAAISRIFRVRLKSPLRLSERRENTLFKLLDNVTTYVISFIALVTILNEFMNVSGILAGAGVVGLAIGFGAQSLVKDIITGFFIIFEHQFSVGDHVRIGNFEGDVEEIGLRTTKIKNWTGEVHILPNSSITEVTNYSIHNSVAVVDISIAYEEDIDRAQKIIQEVVASVKPNYPEMVSEPQVLGVQMIGTSEVVIRVTAEVLPMTHFMIARELRRILKIELDKAGIEIPYPKMITYHKDKTQSTPSVDKDHS